ncbi:MAG: phage BR0599 family protein [Rhodospirillales bacterium]
MFDAEDLRSGRFDYASLEIFLVNYAAPAAGKIKLKRGILGEIILNEHGQFRAELRGLTQVLNQVAGEVYGPECRASLGDERCQVNLPALQHTGSVGAVIDAAGRRVFATLGVAAPAGFFDFGLVVWTGGANEGASCEVTTWDPATGQCDLFLPMGYRIEAGDTFTLYPGCDKRLATCQGRYNNVVNFRGFPHIPGMDKLLEYPLE